MSIPAFLLGFLPFVNLFRAFPIPGLWTELASLLAFGLWLLFETRVKVDAPARVDPLQAALLLLIIAIMMRSGDGGAFWGLVCCLALVCCMAIHVSCSKFGHEQDPVRLSGQLDSWAFGLTAAFLLNVAASVLAWQELEWVLYTLVPATPPDRMGGTFGQPNQFGVFCGLAIAAIVHLEAKRKIPPSAAFLGVGIAVAAIAMAGSRSALLVWGFVWLMTRRKSSTPGLARAMFHAQWVAMILAQLLWLQHAGERGSSTAEGAASVFTRPSGAPRLEQWRDAWQLFVMNPLSGVGWGRFAEARFFTLDGSMSEPEAAHAHNLFSHLIVELGVFGWLASGFLIWQVWRLSRKASHLEGERLLPSIGALALMIYAMFEYPFWSLNFLFTFVWLSALVVPSAAGRQALSGVGLRALGVLMVLSAAWLAMDYANFQRRLMQVDVFIRGGEPQAISEMDVLEVRRQTFFVNAVDEFWIDTSSRLDGAGAMKWSVVERLFSVTPTAGGGIKYVMYAVLAGQQEKAAFVLDRFRSSAPSYMFPMMMKVLRREAREDPALDAFLKGYGQARSGLPDAPEPAPGSQVKPGSS